jgi:WD40 repeat protein
MSVAARGMPRLAALSGDGTRLAVAGAADAITVHDTRTGRVVCRLEGAATGVSSLTLHPDGRRLATSHRHPARSASQVRLWDAVGGQELLLITSSEATSQMLSFSGDGGRLRGLAVVGLTLGVQTWDGRPLP